MIKLLTYWIIGIVILAIVCGIAVLSAVLYEMFREEYFFIIFSILFVALPMFVGVVAHTFREWYTKL